MTRPAQQTAPKPRTPPFWLVVVVTMTGTVGLHVFIPALPAAARDVGATPNEIGLTITLYLVGLAAGQLVYGPVSDRWGRRPVLIAAMAAYLAGLLAAIPAGSLNLLLGARILQSLGACGALVLGRAMVRDVSTDEDAARKLGLLIACMSLTPTLAPGIGGLIEAWLGWRAIFVILAATVAILLLLTVVTVPETHPPVPAAPGGRAYGTLLRSGKFRRYLLAGACSGTSLYAFLATAPFLYTSLLGRPAGEVGLFCVLVSVGMVIGTVLVRALVGRMEVRSGARLGNAISCAAAALLLAAALTGSVTVATLTGTMFLYALGAGIGGPNMVAGAMNVDPDAAGTASGLYGFTQMAVGAFLTFAVGLWHDGTALPLAAVLLAASGAAALSLQRL